LSEFNPTPYDIRFTQRFSGNLLSNIVYFILNVIIGLALVPFFLDTLGEAAYGLIPLATSITSYVTLLIDAVNTSVSRFLTIDLHRGDVENANRTFNTSLFGTLAIIILTVPVALGVAWMAPSFFSIGDLAVSDVFLLFALVFGSVLIRAWSSNFMVTLFACNRLDLRNYVNITNLVVQLLLVVVLFLCLGPSLVLVGCSYLVAAVAAFAVAFILSRRQCPFLEISSRYFVRSLFGELVGTAGWFAFISIGNLLFMNIALIIVNKLFGEVAGAEYSLAFTWGLLLFSIASLVTNVFTPMFFSYYAKGDTTGLIRFGSFSTRCTGLFMALPIGLICVFAPQLLTLWIGAEYARLAPLVWIIVLPVLVRVQAGCIYPIYVAYKKVRAPAVATCVIGVLNVILALSLPHVFNIGMYGVAYASAISMVLFSIGFSSLYNAHVAGAPRFEFLKQMLVGVCALGVLCVAGSAVMLILSLTGILPLPVVNSSTLPILTLVGCGITAGYMLFVLKVVLLPEERKMIYSCLPEECLRKIPSWLL
jgi:O-antigen/teichoic acid export membrane protein